MERVTGIEPALSAWEADVLPLNYTRAAGRPSPIPGASVTLTDAPGHRHTVGPPAAKVPGTPTRYRVRVLLSDADIRAEIDAGRVCLEPYDEEMVQPSSIDVRLDKLFRLFDNHKYPYIDPAEDQPDLTRLVEVDKGEPFILHPGEFVLGSTYEVVTLPDDLAARLEGKSSLGRLGLLTHSTAGFVDPGFSGHVTLELSNVATLPIKLWPGMKIGQLCFIRLSSPAQNPYGSEKYGSRYQGQRGPTASRSFQNFHQTQV
jgi:dCTP deaminase